MIRLLLAIAIAGPAYAGDFDGARRSFALGVQHFDAGRFEEAAAEFRRSLSLRESPPVYLNLALALRALGDHAGAIGALRSITEGELLADARRLLIDSESKVAQVVVLAETAEQVLVDGVPVGAGKLVLAPGEHRFVARRAGHDVNVREVTLEPGSVTELELDASKNHLLVKPEPLPVEFEPLPPAPEPITDQWWFWASIAAVLAAAAGGAAAAAMMVDRPATGGNLGVVFAPEEQR